MVKVFAILWLFISSILQAVMYGGIALAVGLGVDHITPQWDLEIYALALGGFVFAYHFISNMIASVIGAIMIIGME